MKSGTQAHGDLTRTVQSTQYGWESSPNHRCTLREYFFRHLCNFLLFFLRHPPSVEFKQPGMIRRSPTTRAARVQFPTDAPNQSNRVQCTVVKRHSSVLLTSPLLDRRKIHKPISDMLYSLSSSHSWWPYPDRFPASFSFLWKFSCIYDIRIPIFTLVSLSSFSMIFGKAIPDVNRLSHLNYLR